MSSIRRSDPEYQTAMREAKELFDAAMAKSSTKGRVGRPKVAPAPAAAPDIDDIEDIDDLAEIGELEAIVESAAVDAAADETDGAVDPIDPDAAADDSATPAVRDGEPNLRRRASDH